MASLQQHLLEFEKMKGGRSLQTRRFLNLLLTAGADDDVIDLVSDDEESASPKKKTKMMASKHRPIFKRDIVKIKLFLQSYDGNKTEIRKFIKYLEKHATVKTTGDRDASSRQINYIKYLQKKKNMTIDNEMIDNLTNSEAKEMITELKSPQSKKRKLSTASSTSTVSKPSKVEEKKISAMRDDPPITEKRKGEPTPTYKSKKKDSKLIKVENKRLYGYDLFFDGICYYTGTMKNGLMNGFGILKVYNSGHSIKTYKGTWKDNEIQKGVYIYMPTWQLLDNYEKYRSLNPRVDKQDKEIYEGEFSNNKKHGYGSIVYSGHKRRYKGEFKNGYADGKGVMTYEGSPPWILDGSSIKLEGIFEPLTTKYGMEQGFPQLVKGKIVEKDSGKLIAKVEKNGLDVTYKKRKGFTKSQIFSIIKLFQDNR